MSRRIKIPNLDHLIELYQSGVSLQRISKETRYSRSVLLRRFRQAGVKIRGISDGQRARWRNAGNRVEAATKWLGKAWEARRGMKASKIQLIRTARTKFTKQHPGRPGKYEREIHDFLINNGFDVLWQYPVGPYNLDIALKEGRIAIEISCRTSSHFNGSNIRERLKYLLDRGWFVIYIVATTKRRERLVGPDGRFLKIGGKQKRIIDVQLVGQDLIAWLNHARRNKSLAGYYWVIRGQGKNSSLPGYDFGESPLVPRSLRPSEVS